MKPAYLLLFFLFMISCTCNQGNEQEELQEQPTGNSSKEDLTAFKNYLAGIDTSKVENSRVAVQQFHSLLHKADTAIADSAVVLFNQFHEAMLEKISDKHYKELAYYNGFNFVSADSVSPKNNKAAQYQQQLHQNGFSLYLAEGSAHIKIDWAFYLSAFKNSISHAMEKYFTQIQKEDREGFLVDAGMLIKPKALAQRYLYWEDFLFHYPQFVFVNKIKQRQKEYLTFFLEGVDNTALYEYGTNNLNKDFRAGYDFVLENHPQSKLADLLIPYYMALKEKNKNKTDKIIRQYRRDGLLLDFSEE